MLKLTLACSPYDRMLPLFLGEVTIDGVELRPIPIRTPADIFRRMVDKREFDIAEMSLSEVFRYAAAGVTHFVTLPVFPSRMFRHGFIFINRNAGINSPADLAGKRVGVQRHGMTAAVWIRGILREAYGVRFEDVLWVEGGVNNPGVPSGRGTVPRPGQKITLSVVNDRSLSDLLATGEIDALIGAWVPDSLRTSPDVQRMFPNYHAVERDYFRQTGHFPIMHALVLRTDLHEAHPWLARAVHDAAEQSKVLARQHLHITGALPVMLPWLYEHLDEIDAVFGQNFWPYGLQANRATLMVFGQMLQRDQIVDLVPPLDKVFLPLN